MLNPGADSILLPTSEFLLETLICFREKNQLLYFNSDYTSCDVDTSWVEATDIPVVSGDVKIVVSTDVFTVTVPKVYQQTVKCYIYDLTGRLLLQKQLTEQTTRIDLSALSKGVYVYEVVSNNQKLKSGKLPVQ